MADGATTVWGFTLPEVGASADTWGGKLNTVLAFIDYVLSGHATSGVADTYTLTTGFSVVGYVAGATLKIRPNATNTGAATFNLDGLGAKAITKNGSTALVAGDLVSGNTYEISYDGTRWQLVGNTATGVFQPLDATLTAAAALSHTSGNMLWQMTAPDTISLTLTPSVTKLITALGSVSDCAVQNVSNAGTGQYYPSATQLAWATNGTQRLFASSGGFLVSVPIQGPTTGSVSAPGLCPSSGDTNSGFYPIGADNIGLALGGAKVVDCATTGITVTGAIEATTTLRGRAMLSSETSGTLTSASANKRVKATAGVTINDGVFTAEDCVEIYNDSDSSITLTQDTGMTLRLAGTTSTGNRTLAARAIAYVYFDTNADAAVAGSGVS